MKFLSEVKIDFKYPDFIGQASLLKKNLPGLIAATLQTQRAMIFDREGAYNGRTRWAPLKCRKGQILSLRGTLRKSIGPMPAGPVTPGFATGSIVRYGAGVVTIGTSIKYAHVHEKGAVIVPVSKKALRYKCGDRWVFSKKSVIPPRPFGDFTQQDVAELKDTVEAYIASVMGGLS